MKNPRRPLNHVCVKLRELDGTAMDGELVENDQSNFLFTSNAQTKREFLRGEPCALYIKLLSRTKM